MEAAFILLLQEYKGVGRDSQAENNFLLPNPVFNTVSKQLISRRQSPVSPAPPSTDAGASTCSYGCAQIDVQTYSSCVIWCRYHHKTDLLLPGSARLLTRAFCCTGFLYACQQTSKPHRC